jgi:hypothetical protein
MALHLGEFCVGKAVLEMLAHGDDRPGTNAPAVRRTLSSLREKVAYHGLDAPGQSPAPLVEVFFVGATRAAHGTGWPAPRMLSLVGLDGFKVHLGQLRLGCRLHFQLDAFGVSPASNGPAPPWFPAFKGLGPGRSNSDRPRFIIWPILLAWLKMAIRLLADELLGGQNSLRDSWQVVQMVEALGEVNVGVGRLLILHPVSALDVDNIVYEGEVPVSTPAMPHDASLEFPR